METYGGMDVQLHVFLTLKLGVSGQPHALLYSWEEPPLSTGYEGPRYNLDRGKEKNLCP
jgi:hypothetical protein